MNNPVNFKLAKLLKEKGYEQNPYKVANSYLPRYKDGSGIYLNNSLYAPEYNICTAPTITEVVMWLYEKHNIWVGVMREKEVGAVAEDPYYFTYDDGRHIYNTPIEAYEAVIDFYLNNLR